MIDAYIIYLGILTEKLNKFFSAQEPYIFCKEGCSYCCEEGEYPFSEIEYEYLMLGFGNLPEDTQKIIEEKIKQIKEVRAKNQDAEVFLYECPFLVDKKCSVYDYRGIICRTHGLGFFNDEGKIKIPNCVHKGLNYSNVYDPETGMFSSEKWKASGIETEPLSYNLSRKFLLNNQTTKYLQLNFGEDKRLIDWME